MQLLCIGLAGAAGVLLRYWTSLGLARFELLRVHGVAPPISTLVVNVLGSFLIGWIAVLGLEKAAIGETTRLALIVGLLGGFTTFSSFAFETVKLFESGHWTMGILNVIVSVSLCVLASAAGIFLAR